MEHSLKCQKGINMANFSAIKVSNDFVARNFFWPIMTFFDQCRGKYTLLCKLNDALQDTEATVKHYSGAGMPDCLCHMQQQTYSLTKFIKLRTRLLPRSILAFNNFDMK